MRRCIVLIPTLLVVLMAVAAPFAALADPAPFCSDNAPPKLDQAFAGLASILGDRVGTPTECEHAEQATGDLQQNTSTGLFYLRESTNTSTFTDGADHWALRGAQSFHWTTPEADPPATAEVNTVAAPAPQPTLAPAGNVAAPAVSVSGSGPGIPETVLSVIVVVVGLLLCVGIALFLQRQRRGSFAGVSRSTQLVAAGAVAPAVGLRTAAGAPYVPTVSVGELQSAITDIGTNRITEQADAVLRADSEAMTWQASPSALAILLPGIVKWLVVFVIGVFVRFWVGRFVAGAIGEQSSRNVETTVEWVVILIPLLGLAYSATVSWVRIRTTKYRATRQRLEISTGVFGQTTVTHELFQLRDATIERPFIYRILGVGNLVLADRTKGAVRLHAIANPDGVRDILRSSGQIEGARIDRAQWR